MSLPTAQKFAWSLANAQSANRRGDPRESYWAARAFSIR